MDFGFIPFLLFIAFVVIRITKEAAQVNRDRPNVEDPILEPEQEVGGARDISDFLGELKRMHVPPPSPEEDPAEARKLRDRMREAAHRNRAMKTKIPEAPLSVGLAKKPVKEDDFYTVSAAAAYSEKPNVQRPGGLEHPVFGGVSGEKMTTAKRAIVLRDVLGPPLGLR